MSRRTRWRRAGLALAIPVLSANMDTVTESEMAIAMARCGGLGIIHRFMPVERQAGEVARVKRAEGYVVEEPVTIEPHASIRQARQLLSAAGIGGLVVVDRQARVLGMVTEPRPAVRARRGGAGQRGDDAARATGDAAGARRPAARHVSSSTPIVWRSSRCSTARASSAG